MCKICTKCKEEKELNEYYKDSFSKDGYYSCCKNCKYYKTEEVLKNKVLFLHGYKKCVSCKQNKLFEGFEHNKILSNNCKLCIKLKGVLRAIKQRCNNSKSEAYKYYGKRGIKNYLNVNNLEYLWKKDKADLMKKPSIDRINTDGNYTLENCRFIEHIDNIIKSNKEKNIKAVFQYDLNRKFIREWTSIISIEKKLGIDHRQICANLKNKQRTCYGFIWEYKHT